MKQEKWEMMTRGRVYLQRFAMALLGIKDDGAKEFLISPISDVLFINVGPKVWFAWNKKQISDYGKKLLELIPSQKKFQKHCQVLIGQYRLANNWAEKIRNLNLKQQTNRQLIDLYRGLYNATGKVQVLLGADVDCIDLFFETFLQSELKKELKGKLNDEEFLPLYKKLSVPAYTSFITNQHRDTLLAALAAKNVLAAAGRLEKKYWWTALGWENVLPHTKKFFIGEINRGKKSGDIRDKFRAINGQERLIKKHRGLEIQKYRLSSKFQYLLNVLDKYASLHDLRKEMQVKNVYAFHLLLKESARRLKLGEEDLAWTWYQETQEMLAGKKFDRKEIERRKKAFGAIIINHRMKTYSGDDAIKMLKKILKSGQSKTAEAKGLGVTKGVVKGKVKVCSGYREALEKIKQGNILITGMTLPDYLPAMKKAAAIVTDEGGITCHAAIVSRELGKVCVVGTKTASQIFKDGDIVEVDANKGIVKKL
jgi:phosphohistidine swiveling domain-containing protein